MPMHLNFEQQLRRITDSMPTLDTSELLESIENNASEDTFNHAYSAYRSQHGRAFGDMLFKTHGVFALGYMFRACVSTANPHFGRFLDDAIAVVRHAFRLQSAHALFAGTNGYAVYDFMIRTDNAPLGAVVDEFTDRMIRLFGETAPAAWREEAYRDAVSDLLNERSVVYHSQWVSRIERHLQRAYITPRLTTASVSADRVSPPRNIWPGFSGAPSFVTRFDDDLTAAANQARVEELIRERAGQMQSDIYADAARYLFSDAPTESNAETPAETGTNLHEAMQELVREADNRRGMFDSHFSSWLSPFSAPGRLSARGQNAQHARDLRQRVETLQQEQAARAGAPLYVDAPNALRSVWERIGGEGPAPVRDVVKTAHYHECPKHGLIDRCGQDVVVDTQGLQLCQLNGAPNETVYYENVCPVCLHEALLTCERVEPVKDVNQYQHKRREDAAA